jgi:hypothetical protein
MHECPNPAALCLIAVLLLLTGYMFGTWRKP